MTATSAVPPKSPSGSLQWAGHALGFGLGGFFDGILLHQILQWHHLLSGIEEARTDIRVLIVADGLFHVLMYVITGLGLWLLWRARAEFSMPLADRRLFGDALIGFGAWHILDSILSHWVLGIHRIRMDVDNPLFWDLLWFALFGVVPIVIGVILRRRQSLAARLLPSSPLALVMAVLVSGPLAALPPPDQSTLMVLFRPDISPARALAAIIAVNGRLLWSDPAGQLFAIEAGEQGSAGELYALGALFVSSSILPAGCFDWLRA
jgi:uncharacterized membrane protein